ncbi:hypothetical protein [Parasitella parasitica]|uniref:SUN domain-containing protein n=1 Tax=Parasitella parasitica TaxID=35722 RepID=A0A0B7MU49_9FUNG|nr:hypothetical protein [Parasitella parasitica]
MDTFTTSSTSKTRPDMKLRSGKNIPRPNLRKNGSRREIQEGHQQGQDPESWKSSFLRLVVAPILVIFNALRWPGWDQLDALKQGAHKLMDCIKTDGTAIVLISLEVIIISIQDILQQLYFLVNRFKRSQIYLYLLIGSIILSGIYLLRPSVFTAADYQAIMGVSRSRAKQYISFAKHLDEIDSKVTELASRLEQYFQKSQYSNKMILEQMSFLSSQIKEQQSQLNYQREDYRRIWDALYTQNQYMLSVSNDIKLDVIEALQDNTVAVFDRKNEELKISPDFLRYMQTADFIQAFIQHNKQTIRSFIQEELQHFYATPKDKTDSIIKTVELGPASLEHLVEKTVKKYCQEDDEPDFALRSRGGSIISSRTSATYRPPTTSKSLLLRALGYYLRVKSPWAAIHPSTQVGECWSMNGSNGTIGISLSTKIFMESVTLVHPSANVLLGDIINAPRVFRVFAVASDPMYLEDELVFLGEFEYNIHSQYKTQKFLLVENIDQAYQAAVIQFLSNWGNPDFTDVYRIKISGKPASTDE